MPFLQHFSRSSDTSHSLELGTFSSHSSRSCWELPTLKRSQCGRWASFRADGRSFCFLGKCPNSGNYFLVGRQVTSIFLPCFWNGLISPLFWGCFWSFFYISILRSPHEARCHFHSCTLYSGHQWDFISSRSCGGEDNLVIPGGTEEEKVMKAKLHWPWSTRSEWEYYLEECIQTAGISIVTQLKDK